MNEDARTLGYVKRFMECVKMIPGCRETFETDPKTSLQILGIPYAPEDVQYYCTENGKKALYKDSPIDQYLRFLENYSKIEMEMFENVLPENPKMKKWREQQIIRCTSSGLDKRFYIPTAFELSSGCSVGCDFCGLASSRLKQIYVYNHANAKLFEAVLQKAIEIIGKAAAHGILYYATEPLDNPHYEEFAEIVYQECGVLPQITTAAPLRNIERTRKLLKRLNQNANMFYRFSLLKIEDFFEVYDQFNPEDLLYTLLLPRFPEVSHEFVSSGRMATDKGQYNGTIACVTGFVINMCDKTISLRAPCNADQEHPTGEIIIATSTFRDEDEFGYEMEKLIDRKMD